MQTTVILLAIVANVDSYSNNCKTIGLNLITADSYYNNSKDINSAVTTEDSNSLLLLILVGGLDLCIEI